MRCDVIAQGIIDAARQLSLKIPIVVRLQGETSIVYTLIMAVTLVFFFFVCCFKFRLWQFSSYVIKAHGTGVSVRVQLLIGETLLQEKSSSGQRWGLNPGPWQIAWPLLQAR